MEKSVVGIYTYIFIVSIFFVLFIFSGNCCSYLPRLTVIDGQGNMKMESIDMSGGHIFNTTVEDFDFLIKPTVNEKVITTKT